MIGAWTTASLPKTAGGGWTQVSRLGMPLVNEVIIGLPDKNKFNASQPSGDAQFINYVTNPSLPVLLNALFGNAAQVPQSGSGGRTPAPPMTPPPQIGGAPQDGKRTH